MVTAKDSPSDPEFWRGQISYHEREIQGILLLKTCTNVHPSRLLLQRAGLLDVTYHPVEASSHQSFQAARESRLSFPVAQGTALDLVRR